MGEGETLRDALVAWRARMGWSWGRSAAELRIPPTTLKGYAMGRPSALEGTVRRLMARLEHGEAG